MPSHVLEGTRLPFRLSDLQRPPERLYLEGELPGGLVVAIVGTRRATRESARWTRALAASLARRGIVVASGGAFGIDRAAHEGALSVGVPGTALVVAPSGWDRPYPRPHAELFQRVVASGGAYLSVRPPKETGFVGAFFERNAVLAALAHAVIVVQAGVASGARNTAAQARRLQRPLYVVPLSPWEPSSRGNAVELALGARPFVSLAELLGDLGMAPPTRPPLRQQALPGLTSTTPPPSSSAPVSGVAAAPEGARQAIVAALTGRVADLDELVLRTGLTVPVLRAELLELGLEGRVAVLPGARYALIKV